MILKASQRGNARELARHLMNVQDNERIELHSVNGFIGTTVYDALLEIEATAKGTKCTQPLFSVSLNPPKGEIATIDDFEDAISRIAARNGLADQPHVIVFHEKQGRRHAHCVWSRIDAEEMKAINLPFYKNRMMEISRELYLEQGWELPQGFIDQDKRNPLNFSLQEWQQAKRLKDDPRIIKQIFTECWEQSDSKQAFETALDQHGFALARGDKRGFVAVDWRGEVFSLSRWCAVKTKALKNRLGDPNTLPSVSQARETFDHQLREKMKTLLHDIEQKYRPYFVAINREKTRLIDRHDQEREDLEQQHQERQQQEIQTRQARFNQKFLGKLWDRVNGRHRQIQEWNEREAYQSLMRDRKEKDALIHRQLEGRRALQTNIDQVTMQQYADMQKLKTAVLTNLPEEKREPLRADFERAYPMPEHMRTLERD